MPLDIGMIHFIGIGGIGMSGIAEVMHNLGYGVQGSDIAENANVERLRTSLDEKEALLEESTRQLEADRAAAEPRNLNLRPSNLAARISGIVSVPGAIIAISVPSFLATLAI